jgi:hypothetical protein
MKKRLINLVTTAFLLVLIACGGGGGGYDAPIGSTITVSPPAIPYDSIAGDVIVNISVLVKNAEGIPLNNVAIVISGSMAEPRVPARYQFHEGFNASDPVNSGFSAVTDQNGVYEFSIKIYAEVGGSPSEFTDQITVNAAGAFKSVEVSLGAAATP